MMDLLCRMPLPQQVQQQRLMSSGNYFCYIAAYSYPEADTAASLQMLSVAAYPIGAKIIGDAYLSTGDVDMQSAG